ncbi:MAG TPA: hypothetical protein VNT75_23040 [Symbiobacteriaceae bacterium]|nr:hypothetical protein [Symbiobacteriaceae bacterium]
MANRPKQNRAEQDDAPNMKLVKPPEGGIHENVGLATTKQVSGSQQQEQNG